MSGCPSCKCDADRIVIVVNPDLDDDGGGVDDGE